MNNQYNVFENIVVNLLYTFIEAYYEDKYSFNEVNDFVKFIENKELIIWHFNLDKSSTYYKMTKIKEYQENYNDIVDFLNKILKLYNFEMINDWHDVEKSFSFRKFLKSNNLTIKDYTESLKRDFSNPVTSRYFKDNELYINYKENINKFGVRYLNLLENIDVPFLILLKLFELINSNEFLLKYYFKDAILIFQSEHKNLTLNLNSPENFDKILIILKQINFIKSYSRNSDITIYTSLLIKIGDVEIKLKKYQHDFIISWIYNNTSNLNFIIVLNRKIRTNKTINSNLTSNQLRHIGTSNFNENIKYLLNRSKDKETNKRIINYLAEFCKSKYH